MKRTILIASFMFAGFMSAFAQQSIEGFDETPTQSSDRVAVEVIEAPVVGINPIVTASSKSLNLSNQETLRIKKMRDRKNPEALKAENKVSIFSKTLALILAIPISPLPFLGIHRFYMGYTTEGIIYIILTALVFTAFISFIWACIDFIRIAVGDLPY